MRIKKSYEVHAAPDHIAGHFGRVRLMRKADGKHQLFGGSIEAQVAVRKWCELYASFVVFVEPSEHEVVLEA